MSSLCVFPACLSSAAGRCGKNSRPNRPYAFGDQTSKNFATTIFAILNLNLKPLGNGGIMKFQIGYRVLILHSNEEGEVIDIINNKMVMVDVRGVKFPAYIDQLDFPYFKKFSENKLFPKKKDKKYIEDVKKEKDVPKVADGMWITFLPVMETDEFGDEVVEELKIHLINRTDAAYKFI